MKNIYKNKKEKKLKPEVYTKKFAFSLLDRKNLYAERNSSNPKNSTTWFGHIEKFKEQQGILDEYKTNAILASDPKKGKPIGYCKKFIPANVDEWIEKPAPTKPDIEAANVAGFFK